MRYFARTEPARRLRRFYILDLNPTLFGETALMVEWGRAGQAGTLRIRTFDDAGAAEQAAAAVIRRRLQRGYAQKSILVAPGERNAFPSLT